MISIADLGKGMKDKEFNDNVALVSNEIKKELAITPDIKFDYADQLHS